MKNSIKIEFDDVIQGEKFQALQNNHNIFFLETYLVNDFFINNNFLEPFVLITHNSDDKIRYGNDNEEKEKHEKPAYASLIPKNLIKWFGQNVCANHEKVCSIPIGLENSKWFPEERKIEKILKIRDSDLEDNNLLYSCFNVDNNKKERSFVFDFFKDKNWVTTEIGKNGNNFDNYLYNLKSHKFVLCPEGNGTDTHRLWETLYVGSIPIEKRNINNSFYEDLPICFVDEWNQINEEFLKKEYERIKSYNWNIEKLKFSFWKNKILNQFL